MSEVFPFFPPKQSIYSRDVYLPPEHRWNNNIQPPATITMRAKDGAG
jgi:hypothetical protein